MERPSGPDVHAIRGVLLELAGFTSLRVTLIVRGDGSTAELCGSPVQLLNRLEEYTGSDSVTALSFGTRG